MSERTEECQEGAPLRRVRLCHGIEHVRVEPLDGEPPFPLPPLPKYLTDRVALLIERVYRERRRCLAVLLLFDAWSGDWCASIPTQTLGTHASCWSGRVAEAGVADKLLLGSAQAVVRRGGGSLFQFPPPHDGVHLVVDFGQTPPRIHCLMRVDEELESVEAPAVIIDDVEALVRVAMPRLTFE